MGFGKVRRPGWVRFPSIPANLPTRGSQDDGHSSERPRTLAGLRPGVKRSKLFLERSANVAANTFTEPALAGDSDVDRTIARPGASPSLEILLMLLWRGTYDSSVWCSA
jgi:hypothetical protein